jgi:hypothetical protein
MALSQYSAVTGRKRPSTRLPELRARAAFIRPIEEQEKQDEYYDKIMALDTRRADIADAELGLSRKRLGLAKDAQEANERSANTANIIGGAKLGVDVAGGYLRNKDRIDSWFGFGGDDTAAAGGKIGTTIGDAAKTSLAGGGGTDTVRRATDTALEAGTGLPSIRPAGVATPATATPAATGGFNWPMATKETLTSGAAGALTGHIAENIGGGRSALTKAAKGIAGGAAGGIGANLLTGGVDSVSDAAASGFSGAAGWGVKKLAETGLSALGFDWF